MKVLKLLILLISTQQTCFAQTNNIIKFEKHLNYIDSIQNEKQIEDLLIKIDPNYLNFKVNSKMKFEDEICQKTSDSLKIKPWIKSDFDNNGFSDILVVGKYPGHSILCILDKGNRKYQIKRITRNSFQHCTFPVVAENKTNSEINYFYKEEDIYENWGEKHKLTIKTLLYKFGDFIEKNENINKHDIEKIEYSTSSCFGTCPVFTLEINSKKLATLNAKNYNKIDNKNVNGKFESKIDDVKYNEIIDLLNYLNFEKLKNNYSVNWTDDQTCALKITYDDGQIKTINDYGLIGTFGLNRVYKLITELRENQKWK
jgi:hypothetical protein